MFGIRPTCQCEGNHTYYGLKITQACNQKWSSKFVREYCVLHSTLKNLMSLFIKIFSLYNPIRFLAILYPKSPSNLMVDVGIRHSHQLLLTHWGWVTHICVGNLATIGSDNGLLPGRRQAITWTNAGILLIGPLWTNFSEILIEIPTFSFKKMHLKVSSAKWRPSCLGLNVLRLISTHHVTYCMGECIQT